MNDVFVYELNQDDIDVLAYLKKMKQATPEYYSALAMYGARLNDIVKFIERPKETVRWPNDFWDQVEEAIPKIAKNYARYYPEIPKQKLEDKLLAKFLKNSGINFVPKDVCGFEITNKYIIKYLERDAEMYTWTGCFLIQVINHTKKVKEMLLK